MIFEIIFEYQEPSQNKEDRGFGLFFKLWIFSVYKYVKNNDKKREVGFVRSSRCDWEYEKGLKQVFSTWQHVF